MKNKIQKLVFAISLVVLSVVGTVGSVYAIGARGQQGPAGDCDNGCVMGSKGCVCNGWHWLNEA